MSHGNYSVFPIVNGINPDPGRCTRYAGVFHLSLLCLPRYTMLYMLYNIPICLLLRSTVYHHIGGLLSKYSSSGLVETSQHTGSANPEKR